MKDKGGDDIKKVWKEIAPHGKPERYPSHVKQNQPEQNKPAPIQVIVVSRKSKTTVFFLWLFLAWTGAHQFYLGNGSKGIAYLACTIFFILWMSSCMTYDPIWGVTPTPVYEKSMPALSVFGWGGTIVWIIDIIAIIAMDSETFDSRYNKRLYEKMRGVA